MISNDPTTDEFESNNIKLFYCDYCDYKTSRKSNMERHINQVHEGKCYECYLCSAIVRYFSQHMISIHDVKGKKYKYPKVVDQGCTKKSSILSSSAGNQSLPSSIPEDLMDILNTTNDENETPRDHIQQQFATQLIKHLRHNCLNICCINDQTKSSL